MSREDAYAAVQAAALRAADERIQLRDTLAAEPAVNERISPADLDACFDLAAYTGHVGTIIARLDMLEERIDAHP
jgi:adenylosuccinate lyase